MDLKAKFGDILKANGIQDEILEVVTRKVPELKGSHMASLIEYATVKFVNVFKEPLELFVKKTISMGNEMIDESFIKMTDKEGRFLEEFVNDMKKFCREKTGTDNLIESLFPRVYYRDADMILMDNLVTADYVMLDKLERQDLATAKLVLKRLAEFHGVSYGMIQEAGGRSQFEEKYDYFEDHFMKPETGPMMDQMFDSNLGLTCTILEKAGAAEHQELSKKLKSCVIGSSFSEILRVIQLKELFPVVIHGDFWTNNFMLRGAAQDPDRQVIFVDLQAASINSPSIDLTKYLFTSLKPELRKQWKDLIEFYFEHLKTTVLNLGIEFPYELEAFVEDFRGKAKMGFQLGMFLVISFEAMDGHDTDDANKSGEDFAENFVAMMSAWVENNPDKSAKVCSDIKAIVDDYLLIGTL